MILKGKYNEAKVFTDNICVKQIENLLNQPAFSGSTIRIMPDCHAGKGCTIGFTMDIKDKVVPNLVGVDIGCGMFVVDLKLLKQEIDFKKLDNVINEFVPVGFKIRKEPFNQEVKCRVAQTIYFLDSVVTDDRIDYIINSVGTLGGGNHFIEIAESEKFKNCYLIIHSGSRNLGVQVCKDWQITAIDNLRWMMNVSKEEIPDELCYLEGSDKKSYLNDVKICTKYAQINRETIALAIIENMGWKEISPLADSFHTIHNYVGVDDIIRKGAIAAYKGEQVLIPLNMRDGSLLCIGKGNPDWNYSAPHGAGRILSRTQAKKEISLTDFQDAMKGIYTTSVCKNTLDEAPFAYKQGIEELISDTVTVIDRLKTVYNFKAK